MSESTISVIIPCRNADLFLEQALESVLSQEVDGVDTIVIDDGSTDSTGRILSRYADRIHVECIDNKGAAHARNLGLSVARGEFIKFLDADDFLLEGVLREQLKHMERYCPEPNQILFGGYRTNSTVDHERTERITYPLENGDEVDLAWLIRNQILTSPPLHRRQLLSAVGGFDAGLKRGQEFDLHLRLALHGARFVFCDDMVYHYRNHAGDSRLSHGSVLKNARWLQAILMNLVLQFHKSDVDQPEARRAAAHLSWKTGRSLIQKGGEDEARPFFLLARLADEKNHVYGSRLYRGLVRLAGPKAAEEVGKMRARLVAKLF